jgi:hypothetical protein
MTDEQYSDAARRCSWNVTIALLADKERAVNSWLAIRLSDGDCNGTLYDKKEDAVRDHMNLMFPYCYVKIPADGMGAREAEVFLKFNRDLFDNGMRMSDPELGEREVIMPSRLELL